MTSFSLDDMTAVRLTVIRQANAQPDETEDEFIVWRKEGTFLLEQTTIPHAALQGLPQAITAATPALGIQRCGDMADRDYLELRIDILIKQRRPLRLMSNSRCRYRLPWNITDGERLAVISDIQTGAAIHAFVQTLIDDRPDASHHVPEAAGQATGDADFVRIYQTLLTEWRRLGKTHAAVDVKLQTEHLSAALQWMDAARHERGLHSTARHDRGSAGIFARDALRMLRTARWGYIDKRGNFTLPRRYERAESFAAGNALVRLNGIWQLIDRRGHPVRHARTGEPSYLPVRLQPFEQAGKWGFADHAGQPVIAALFDAVEPFQDGRAAAQSNGKWGFIDEQGTWAIAPQFDAARSFNEHLAAVKRDGLWGYIDRKGQSVIAPRFLDAGDFGDGLAPVR